jgi:hypothetical protein
LTLPERSILRYLKQHQDFLILPTDKNLGPAILNREDYIKKVLNEHLLTPAYTQLQNHEANNRIADTKNNLLKIYNEQKHLLSKAETTFFSRNFKENHRTPIFYGLPKVHKSPWTLRPVVSCINSFPSIFSTWIDFKMKELIQLNLFPSYIKDSTDFLNNTKDLIIPLGAKIFTADASSMYTNIDLTTGIQAMETLFQMHANVIPASFPTELLLTSMRIIMANNIFSFGDTHWLQNSGTAMGTPAAPLYATITYGVHENTRILPNFRNHLFYYKRFIDDIIGIWLPSPDQTWKDFKDTLNGFGALSWNIEEPSDHTTFLDLEIRIQDQRLTFKTYQKEHNLYLYIPPSSAHPYSCFKGLIYGEVSRYWRQNQPNDFINIMTSFIQRLMERGHNFKDLIPIIKEAASALDNKNTTKYNDTNENLKRDVLYFHWQHNPSGIKNCTIQKIYNATLHGYDNFDKMVIATSRPKNLRDLLCRTRLTTTDDDNITNIIQSLTSTL